MLNPDLAKPEGLSPMGERAHAAIVAFLEQKGRTNTGGCKAFEAPAAWRDRGEKYGERSVLVIVHDGGDLAPFFNWDYCDYAAVEEMRQALEKVGLFAEQCTSYYSAIYRVDGVVEEQPPPVPLTPEEEAKIAAYRDVDLARLAPVIGEARELWRKRCEEYVSRKGDAGTCVLGAGIAVEYLGPRCRRAKARIVIPAHDVTGAQGASVWESSVEEVLALLKERGVAAWYEPGNMD